jgi:transcriptional regulator with XRE-family HTH domain
MIRLKELREEKGMNMRQTSIALNLPYTTYVSYEKGERGPDSEMLIFLADYFGCSIDYLIGRSNERYNSDSRFETPVINKHQSSKKKPAITDDDVKFALWNGAEGITDEMYEEVRQYAEMVKMREDNNKNNNTK